VAKENRNWKGKPKGPSLLYSEKITNDPALLPEAIALL